MRGKNFGTVPSPVVKLGGAIQNGTRELVALLFRNTTSWTADKSGKYTVYNFAPGGVGGMTNSSNTSVYANPGSSGGAQKKTISLAAGQSIGISIGATGYANHLDNTSKPPGSSTITFPGGSTMTANPGSAGTNNDTIPTSAPGGTASGGDVNVTGPSGAAIRGGDGPSSASIDGIGNFPGGMGVTGAGNLSGPAASVGAGSGGVAATSSGASSIVSGSGGAGMVLIFREP